MGSHPKHNERKLKEIVDNEMRAHVGGRCHMLGVAREKVVEIPNLEDKEDYPIAVSM